MNEEIKAGSVDTPEFAQKLVEYFAAQKDEHAAARKALVEHIDAWAINQLAASGAVVPSLTDEQIDAALERAVQAVAERAGESEAMRVISVFDAIRSLKANRFALPAPKLAATPVAGWVSVEDERKPNEHELVAVIGPAYGSFEKGRYVSSATYYNGEFFTEDGDMMHPPSHWCALPPAPVATPTMQNQQEPESDSRTDEDWFFHPNDD